LETIQDGDTVIVSYNAWVTCCGSSLRGRL